MRIVWSPEAIEDLISLRGYIAQDDPAAARRIALRILDGVEKLLPENPHMAARAAFRARANWSFRGRPISFLIGCNAARWKFCACITAHAAGPTAFDFGGVMPTLAVKLA